jgi:phytoene dehydrogenase-like protein
MRDLDATADSLGRDAGAYRRLLLPIVRDWPKLRHDLLAPLTPFPRNVLAMARFGPVAALPAETLARAAFRGERARAVFAGMAAHSMLPLSYAASAAYGLLLSTLAHAVGWPMPRGGAQSIADALLAVLRDLGGEIESGRFVRSLGELPADAIKLLDVTPRQLLSLAGDALPAGYQHKLRRFRHGPGVFKIDYALSEPVPWRARECAQAATVHLGGTLDEIAASERAAWRGEHCGRPFVLLAQHTLFDPSRAPAGRHTLWAYCHAPRGSTRDMTAEIEAQIERFAPGFRDCIIARHTMNAVDMERHNPNYIGGDINGGAGTLWQTLARPTLSTRPYRTPISGVYLCSQSTPPGGGVHGMCGVHAARAALAG